MWVLVILTLQSGEPVTEPMVFDDGGDCYSTASWVRRIDANARTVCFEIRK